MPRLPAALPPRLDEVFTSWVIRLAEAHGHKPRELCSLVCGQSLEYNPDYGGPNGDKLLAALAVATRLSAERLRSDHAVAGFEGVLFDRTGNPKKLPWVLPHGSHLARHPAMQFCPCCLNEPKPYFRRIWRLSLFTVCPDHFLHLHHVCPACGACVDPVRSEARHQQGTLPLCWKCGFDLRRTPVLRADAADAGMAHEHRTGLMFGDAGLRWPAGVSTREYFTALSLVCTSLVIRKRRLQSWRELAGKATGVILPALSPACVKTVFDTLADPAVRRPVLRTAAWLLEEWPTRFLAQARAAQTRTSDFVPGLTPAPQWFLEPLQSDLTPARRKPVPSPGLLRVRRMRELMLAHRHHWCPSHWPRLIKALREAGFYSPETDDGVIMRSLPNTIARLRAEGKGYHRKLTQQVPRGTPQWSRLIVLAKPYRKEKCSDPAKLRRGILALCARQFLSGRDLSELLHRSQGVLVCRYLVPMVREGQLEARFPVNLGGKRAANPRQAYRCVGRREDAEIGAAVAGFLLP